MFCIIHVPWNSGIGGIVPDTIPGQPGQFRFDIEVLDWNLGTEFVFSKEELDKIERDNNSTCEGNPLCFVAEWNMKDLNGTDASWDKNHDNTGKYLFTYFNAKDAYTSGKEIDGKMWYLPTLKEWMAIFPFNDGAKMFDLSSSNIIEFNQPFVVTINGKDYNMSGVAQGVGGTKGVAMWTYTPVSGTGNVLYVATEYNYSFKLVVKMKRLDSLVSLDLIKDGSVWQGSTPTVRTFSASGHGYRSSGSNDIIGENSGSNGVTNSITNSGREGYYWSSSPSSGNLAWHWAFNNRGLKPTIFYTNQDKGYLYSIRLVSRE